MTATGYTAVTATGQELAAWRAKNPNRPQPSVRRLQCNFCSKRIWGSGLGVGAHNRSKACAAASAEPKVQQVVTIERFQLVSAGGGNYRSAWRWSYNYRIDDGALAQYGTGLKSLCSMLKQKFPGAHVIGTWAPGVQKVSAPTPEVPMEAAPRNDRVSPADLPDDLQEAYELCSLAVEREDSNGDTAASRKAQAVQHEQSAKLLAGGYRVLGSGKLRRV